jgi:hypothetical protein
MFLAWLPALMLGRLKSFFFRHSEDFFASGRLTRRLDSIFRYKSLAASQMRDSEIREKSWLE